MAAHKRIAPIMPYQRGAVYKCVKASGKAGLTCRELARAWKTGMNTISGRFTELKAMGLIEKVGTRDGCAIYKLSK